MSKALLSRKSKNQDNETTATKGGKCLVCDEVCNEERKDLNSWNNLKNIAFEWSGIEPYGEIYHPVCRGWQLHAEVFLLGSKNHAEFLCVHAASVLSIFDMHTKQKSIE